MSPDAYLEMADTEATHWWFSGRRTVLGSLIASLDLPLNAKILEIGSGTGGNLSMLSAFGQVSAIEMDDVARSISTRRSRGRFDIRPGVCPASMPFADERFHLICLLDVLEHIEDDVGTLVEARRRLAPTGWMLVTVPAYRWLWSRHDEYLHHRRRYTSQVLRDTASQASLRVQRITYFNTMLFAPIALARLMDRRRANASPQGSKIPWNIVNRLLYRVFSAERFLLRHFDFPFGVSVLAVLRSI